MTNGEKATVEIEITERYAALNPSQKASVLAQTAREIMRKSLNPVRTINVDCLPTLQDGERFVNEAANFLGMVMDPDSALSGLIQSMYSDFVRAQSFQE